MTQIAENSFDWSSIELLLRQNKFAEMLASLRRRAEAAPAERTMSLYTLFAKVRLHGPQCYEAEIDALRGLTELNQQETDVVRRIFLCGFEAAEKAGDEQKRWAYQRLLRRLLLGQPLTQPIPITPKPPQPRRPIILLEPAAIVPTPVVRMKAGRGRDARPRSIKTAMHPFALGFWAACLLASPMEYMALRDVAAPTRLTIVPTSSTPGLARVRSESEAHGMSAKSEKPIYELDEQQIKNDLVKQLSGLRRAYGQWTAKKRGMTGSISLKLTVDQKGKIVGVDDVQSHLLEPGFIQVVIAEARKWRVPADRAAVSELMVPLLFIPRRQDRNAAGLDYASKAYPNGPNHRPEDAEAAKSIARAHIPAVEPGPQPTIAAIKYGGNENFAMTQLEYVAQQPVALHEEPRFGSLTIEEIKRGMRMTIMEVRGDWFKVRTSHSHAAGFVRKEFVVPFLSAR